MNPREDITVLVAEPAPTTADGIGDALLALPVRVEAAETAEGVLEALKEELPDLLLSEVHLPDASGFSLCRLIRADAHTRDLPVVLVSRWSSEMDRILAFECGADDFVARPFYSRELSSRTAALLRRRLTWEGAAASAEPKHTPAVSVRIGGQRIDLSPKQIAIVGALLQSEGRVCTRRELIQAAWHKEDSPSVRTIDSHIRTLRRKLGEAGKNIVTVRGKGYRFTTHPALKLE